MFPRRLLQLVNKTQFLYNEFHNTGNRLKKFENPILRTLRILKEDLTRVVKPPSFDDYTLQEAFPRYVDILIVGGGAIGTSSAYWLKEKSGLKGLSVLVVEKDETYAKSSTVLSVGGLRQQFSLPENIQMSLYGAEFIRTLQKRFGEDSEVHFTPNGYLMLSSELGAQQLLDNSKLQKDMGAVNKVLNREELKSRFPWLNVEDIELGCLGLEKEGWFDPWALLCILKRGAKEAGAQYFTGEVVEFLFNDISDFYVVGVEPGTYRGTNNAVVKLPNGDLKEVQFAICVIAGGADSGDIAKLAKIGTGPGLLTIPLPVEKRKRYVYCFECQKAGPGINTPMTIDYSGAYFRRDGLGGTYIAGLSPLPEEEPATNDLDVDHQYFNDRIWPILAHRVPDFDGVKVRSGWSGFYDYNAFDENGIVGPHPYYNNIYLATGFSGHGIQQAPAVGRAISEMILDGGFQTIDLTRLGFDRLVVLKPMAESCII